MMRQMAAQLISMTSREGTSHPTDEQGDGIEAQSESPTLDITTELKLH